jgi:hypothetical protein
MPDTSLVFSVGFPVDDEGIQMKSQLFLALSFILQLPIAHAQEACEFEGAIVIADDYANTYLGTVAGKSDAESLFNKEGDYGSANGLDSVWNTNGTFGNEHSIYSARNPQTPSPPMILKDGRVVAYLTANESIANAISLESLKERCSR